MADTWPPRILTLLAWALAAWSITYWVLQFQGAAPAAATPVVAAAKALAAEPADVARVFGPAIQTKAPEPVVAVVVDPSTRFLLSGVVASRAQRGVALLSVEGKPARPYRVGASIDNAYTLKSVTARSAVLVENASGTTFTVALAATGGAAPATGPGVPPAPGTSTTSPSPGNPPAAGPAPTLPMPRFGPIPPASMGRRSS